MKVLIVFALSVAICLAAPLEDSQSAQILRYENENSGVNNFRFAYETSDGISRTEEGELKNVGSEDEAMTVTGSVSWTSPDGQIFTLTYVADENGYRAIGDHLPKAPAVP